MKNLVKVEPETETVRRESTPEQQKIKTLIVQFLWYLKKENYAELTIRAYVNNVKILAKRGANILNPESIKTIIAKQKWSDVRKVRLYYAYDAFTQMLSISWVMPRIRVQQKIGFCPTERTVNQAIAGFGKKVSIKIQLIAETGMRSGEADSLRWDQINFKNATITVNPEKGSTPTVKKVSRELLGRIQSLPNKSEKIFGDLSIGTMITNLEQQRKGLARKLGNPELRKLTFLSIKHFYGTKLYHRGKTLLEIQNIMGHKRFTSTLQYINYDKIIFGDADEWICKVAITNEDRKNLIEAGFQFVEQADNKSYYRKQKV
jgi:integrase